MAAEPLSFTVPDLSAFARALGAALQARQAEQAEHPDRPASPGHVETLNLVARALGYRNVQALRAALRTAPAARTVPPPPPPLSANARKTLQQFDAEGRLVRWPHKFTVQRMAMWILWTRFDAKRKYTEREVNTVLKAANAFEDHVTLRRELVNHQLLTRKSDCSEYRKLPARPDDEVRALLHAWRARGS
jgi:hypothetical protein